MNNWLAPDNTTLPDFIICGAMKSGTTTLHAMLNKHPDIFIPEKEIHFFDMDNIIQHPDFSLYKHEHWRSNNIESSPEKYWQWYSSQFDLAKSDQVIGEDSTTYIASHLVAQRIAAQSKKIKLIVMLRQPSKRVYSQYWHLVRSGRASYTFEASLQLNPSSLLNRSLYYSQIKSLLEHIPKEQIKFVIFEDFIKNKVKVLKDICTFVGVDFEKLTPDTFSLHENASSYPKYYKLQLLKNRLFPFAGNLRYINKFILTDKKQQSTKKGYLSYINALHRKINPLTTKKPENLKPTTKQFLDDYFKKELVGLNELVGRDVMSLWFDE